MWYSLYNRVNFVWKKLFWYQKSVSWSSRFINIIGTKKFFAEISKNSKNIATLENEYELIDSLIES